MAISSQEVLNAPIGTTLRHMTTPMVIGIMAVIMFQAVDTYFIGLLGTTELAAISFTFPVTFTITNLAIGLGIATSILVAQAIGKGNREKASQITTDSLVFCVVLVGLFSIGGNLTINALFTQLGATANTLPIIDEYMTIWYTFVGLLVIPMIANSAIRATGNTKWPSILMMVSGFINAVLDPILIFGYGPVPALGVKGAAYATAASWGVAFLVAMWLLRFKEQLLLFRVSALSALMRFWAVLIKMGSPIVVANMLTPIAIAILTAMVARYGEDAVAAFGAGSRIEAIFMCVVFALTSALSPFMAQNIGASKLDRADTGLQLSLKFTAFFQVFLAAVLLLGSHWFAQIFSDDPNVIAITQQYLWIMPSGAIFYGLVIIMNTSFNATKKSHLTMNLSLVRVFLCVSPCAYLGSLLFDLNGLLIGAVVGNGLSVIFGFYLIKKNPIRPQPIE